MYREPHRSLLVFVPTDRRKCTSWFKKWVHLHKHEGWAKMSHNIFKYVEYKGRNKNIVPLYVKSYGMYILDAIHIIYHKPRSHKGVGVARRSPRGCKSRKDDLVGMRFCLLQVKPLCDQINRRKVFDGRKEVGDWLANGLRPAAVVAENPRAVFSRRLVVDRSPIGCRLVSKQS